MAFNLGVVIACAGKGKRLGRTDKAILKLEGKPLIYYTFKVFSEIKEIKEIVLVLRKPHFKLVKKLISARGKSTFGERNKRVRLVEGGQKRKDSVYNGLVALGKDINYVLIHDGARPFVTKEVIKRILKVLREYPAVICGLRAKDTLKSVDNKEFVKKTLKRENIFFIQTPQGFRKDLLISAYKKFKKSKAFDDAQILESIGKRAKIVKGDIFNIKITYPEDIRLAKAIIKGLCIAHSVI